MVNLRKIEQHIAVFGESGSGKTALLSSFFGAAQEKSFIDSSLFRLNPADQGQGSRLHSLYLGMKDAATLPRLTTKSATYKFFLEMKEAPRNNRGPDGFALVWHDYPGEWWSAGGLDAEEEAARVRAFRGLLESDVALLLVDGQKLLDYAGEEERYLKHLFTSFRHSLCSIRESVVDEGALTRVPRIWMIALSKADLLPDLDVQEFRDLIILKTVDELDELRETLKDIVQGNEALSVGEDFLRLSSARFEPGKIDVTERIGLNLLLPTAFELPIQRYAAWIRGADVPNVVLRNVLEHFDSIVSILLTGLIPRIPKIGPLIVALFGDQLQAWARMGGDELQKFYVDAMAKSEYVKATQARFKLDLERGEAADVLLRSSRWR